MRKVLLATATLGMLWATGAAKADVMLDPHLSGTGDNVVFDSFSGSLAIGSFNGQHILLTSPATLVLPGLPTATILRSLTLATFLSRCLMLRKQWCCQRQRRFSA